jgi:endonuclease-8
MPEGDTLFRAARTMHRALAGQRVVAFASQLEQLLAADRRSVVAGRTVDAVTARGKHLLIELSGELVLRTHQRMHGSWHLYRPGERWRAPRRDARIVLTTAPWVAIAFGVADAELLPRAALAHHPRLAALGPDLLAPEFDAVAARERLRAAPVRHVADALLHQQAVAGLGNVFKSELLFLCRVHPFTPVAAIDDAQLDCLLANARKLMQVSVAPSPIAGGALGGRVTSGRLDPRERRWVYGRTNQPCLYCGTAIASASETGGRRTWWCPRCQPPPV